MVRAVRQTEKMIEAWTRGRRRGQEFGEVWEIGDEDDDEDEDVEMAA